MQYSYAIPFPDEMHDVAKAAITNLKQLGIQVYHDDVRDIFQGRDSETMEPTGTSLFFLLSDRPTD